MKKVKRKSTDWEKVLANHISDKDLHPEYVNKSYNSNTKRKTKQLKN